MFKKLTLISVVISALGPNEMATPLIAQPSFIKNAGNNTNMCVRNIGGLGLNNQVNGQSVPIGNFQKDSEYGKSKVIPLDCIKKVNEKFKKASIAANEKFNQVMKTQDIVPEKNCVYSMDKKTNNCYISNFLDKIVKHPMWNIVLHSNVIQIFFGTKLRKMIIFENFNYVVKDRVKKCITRFKDATAVTKHNIFGTVLNFLGELPKKQKIMCAPCNNNDLARNQNSYIDGNYYSDPSCSSCDPFTQIIGHQSQITDVNTLNEVTKKKNKEKIH